MLSLCAFSKLWVLHQGDALGKVVALGENRQKNVVLLAAAHAVTTRCCRASSSHRIARLAISINAQNNHPRGLAQHSIHDVP
jgi:hypothetical protein